VCPSSFIDRRRVRQVPNTLPRSKALRHGHCRVRISSIGADRGDDGIWIYGLAGSFTIIGKIASTSTKRRRHLAAGQIVADSISYGAQCQNPVTTAANSEAVRQARSNHSKNEAAYIDPSLRTNTGASYTIYSFSLSLITESIKYYFIWI
jgi:hypothetical protein